MEEGHLATEEAGKIEYHWGRRRGGGTCIIAWGKMDCTFGGRTVLCEINDNGSHIGNH
jgi:hypothetical protein